MRRSALVLVPVLVAATLVAAAPSSYADVTTVSRSGLPAGWAFSSTRTDGAAADSTYRHVEGPSGVPTGAGSLRLDHGPHTFKLHLGLDVTPDVAAGDWTTDEITYRSTAEVRVDLGFTSPTFEGAAVVHLPATSTWSTVDLLSQPVSVLVDPKETLLDGRTRTWAELLSTWPGGTIGGLHLEVRTLRTVESTWIDTVRYGTAGSVTTVDFDAAPLPVLTSSTATVTVAAGSSTPLSGRANRVTGAPLAGLPVELWARGYGSSAWVRKVIVTSAADGSFRTTFTPLRRTYVQWRVRTEGYAAASSATRRIDVRARVWATAHDPSIARSTPLRVFGKVAPGLAGATVTLRRVGSTAVLATAVVRADSTYGISARLPRGTWTVYTTTPPTRGVLAGRSAGIRVVVS